MECGCPEGGPHTPQCFAHPAPPVRDPFPLTGTGVRGGDPACGHHWTQVRSRGWLLKAVCRCHAVRRFLPVDFNRALALGRATMIPQRI